MQIKLLSRCRNEKGLFHTYCKNIAGLWSERRCEFDVAFFNCMTPREFHDWVIGKNLKRATSDGTFFDVYLALDEECANQVASFLIFGRSTSLAESNDPKGKAVKSAVHPYRHDPIGEIRTIVTRQNYEGCGYVKILLHLALDKLRRRRFRAVLLEHHGKNERMRQLMKKFRFAGNQFVQIYDGPDSKREKPGISGLRTAVYLLRFSKTHKRELRAGYGQPARATSRSRRRKG